MKSLTIHSMPDELYNKIKQRSEKEHRSLNQILKLILSEALGVNRSEQKRSNEFDDLCGVWGKADLESFEKETADLSKVNKEDWA